MHGVAGLDARQGTTADELWICCPFCGDDRYRLGINVKRNVGHCFNCDWRSRSAIVEIAVAVGNPALAEFGVDQEKSEGAEEPAPESLDYERFQNRRPKDRLESKALQYILGRGVPWEQVQEKKIGFAVSGKYSYRVVFPVRRKRQVVGLIGRSFIAELKPKYLNSRGMKSVFNLPEKRKRNVIIAEGPMDALALERALGTNADCIGLLGRSLSAYKEKQLRRYKEITLWMDRDRAGVEGFSSVAAHLLTGGKDVFAVVSSGAKDAADSTTDELRSMFAARQKWSGTLAARLRAAVAFQ